ncbi:nuclear transport factor 2 family protein [Planomonospora sp. ID82291]|uniref:nuclear transport factor 2 family protein n=1 Tax=Planomonospora sp. ID82291 TaxID=2738136 RepID=UPI0018C3A2D6|nr:nuclear transport factor 2 family protein [Planomonospora sp. ID82291]MBG0817233.1 nuclear transport factor 2 family protein [Planomonospora sp. ID82291]
MPVSDTHATLVRTFYDALARRDLDAMERCYHPDVTFGDPIFQELEGRARIMGMWRLLMGYGTGLDVSLGRVSAGRHEVTADWTAGYTFAATGRRVVNQIDSLFRFESGLIVRQHDDFDFKHWSKMALGRPVGLVVGWTPALRARIRSQAMEGLKESMAPA